MTALKSIPISTARAIVLVKDLVKIDTEYCVKKSPTCEWKSCEFLHNTNQLEREYAETNADRKSPEDRIKKNELKINNSF